MNNNSSQYQTIINAYKAKKSIKDIAREIGVSVTKVRRVLITEGLWSSRSSQQVGELHAQGLSTQEIATRLGVTDKAVESYLPYSKGAYGDSNRSDSAIRSEAYRERNAAAAERQVAKHEPSNRQTVDYEEEDRFDRERGAMLLHLELDTSMLGPKDQEILRRYGRVDKGITRDIIVPANITLHALHYAIQRAFGWQNSHFHNFQLPKEVFESLFDVDGLFTEWMPFCGLYFRFPTEDTDDLYWDDDYNGEVSIKSWLRRKYSGPYHYGGLNEYYMESQVNILAFCHANQEIWVSPSFDEWQNGQKQGASVSLQAATINDIGRVMETNLKELLEKLSLRELLIPEGTALPNDWRQVVKKKADDQKTTFVDNVNPLQALRKKILNAAKLVEEGHEEGGYRYDSAFANYHHLLNQAEIKVLPLTDHLLYQYDFGDGWEVKITCQEVYQTEIGQDEPILEGYTILPITEEQVFNDTRVFDGTGNLIIGTLRDQIASVYSKMRPLCVAADGLNVMDDVGGIGGYCDFLTSIHEDKDQEVRERLDWAREMGWTSRRVKPESIL